MVCSECGSPNDVCEHCGVCAACLPLSELREGCDDEEVLLEGGAD